MDKIYETERLVLKTIGDSKEDAKLILDYFSRNKEHLKPWDPLRTERFYTLDNRQEVLTWELNEMKNSNYLRLWIFEKNDTNYEKIIGTVGISSISRGISMSCNLGYSIDKDKTNKGFVTEAIKKVIYIIFNEYKLHRIEATIMPINKPSLKVVEKLGFEYEGLSKKYQKINGQWEDHIRMALINDNID